MICTAVQCILPQGQTTPEKTLSNPWFGKGFCEPHQYNSAIDRCKGGHQSLELGVEIHRDLVKILENYSAALRQWSTSSQKQIAQSKEFGTTRRVWLDSVRAVEKLAERNDDISQSIRHNVIEKMSTYKNDNYGKSYIHIKIVKQFEKDFKKVQRSWLDLLEKISDAKQSFQDASRKLHHAESAEEVIRTDLGSSDDQKKKAKASVEHRTNETNGYKAKYTKLIEEMNTKQPKYEEDMYKILSETDDFERKRLEHFKSIFTALQVATSIEKDTRHAEMLATFKKTIEKHDIEADIKFFNTHYGRQTKSKWPVFEDLSD